MHKGRLEAFSDGVIAIIITIMVLELKTPHGTEPADLKPVAPVFLSYIMSFVYLGIYWSNHHHLFQIVRHVSGAVLWANLHLLFWLSLVPFATAWVGENGCAPWPAVLYGVVLIGAATAYYILTLVLLSLHGKESAIKKALGNIFKERLSLVLYVAALPLAFLTTVLSYALYIAVAVMWLIPDRRIERVLHEHHEGDR